MGWHLLIVLLDGEIRGYVMCSINSSRDDSLRFMKTRPPLVGRICPNFSPFTSNLNKRSQNNLPRWILDVDWLNQNSFYFDLKRLVYRIN
jgi:hypothetical protein